MYWARLLSRITDVSRLYVRGVTPVSRSGSRIPRKRRILTSHVFSIEKTFRPRCSAMQYEDDAWIEWVAAEVGAVDGQSTRQCVPDLQAHA